MLRSFVYVQMQLQAYIHEWPSAGSVFLQLLHYPLSRQLAAFKLCRRTTFSLWTHLFWTHLFCLVTVLLKKLAVNYAAVLRCHDENRTDALVVDLSRARYM
jgi:hypothetical protein